MARRFSGDKLILATHNAGKLREIAELLRVYVPHVVSAGDVGLPEPDETGLTFEANAELKALAAAQTANLPALADDSGICVDALDGDPGIYTARWAGPDKDFFVAMKRVEDELQARGAAAPAERTARFVCVLTLAWPDGHTETVHGEVEGSLTWPPRGTRGFGFDPVFVPAGKSVTFGEMDPAEKHAMSHRTNAFARLIEACLDGPRP